MKRVTPLPTEAATAKTKTVRPQLPTAKKAAKPGTAKIAKKRCPECGADVPPKTTGVMKIFCSKEHKAKYHSRSKARGQALVPMLLAWRTGRGGTDIAKQAYGQVCTILDDFAREDRLAGRPPVAEYAKKLLWMGTHRDRRRNQ